MPFLMLHSTAISKHRYSAIRALSGVVKNVDEYASPPLSRCAVVRVNSEVSFDSKEFGVSNFRLDKAELLNVAAYRPWAQEAGGQRPTHQVLQRPQKRESGGWSINLIRLPLLTLRGKS